LRDDFTTGNWTKAELVDAGFRYHPARRVITMVRELPVDESPLLIETPLENLIARAGDMICFDGGRRPHPRLYDYPHWPAEPQWFAEYYEAVEDPGWQPTEAQRHLVSLGCRAWVRRGGAWAMRVTRPTRVQSRESPQPVLVPPGTWVCNLGADGDGPKGFWAMNDDAFQWRYEMPACDDLP
jgi:hypothetical protein